MDEIETIMILIVFAMLWIAGGLGVMIHDARILEPHHNEVQIQYFRESDNLTNQGKYNLAKSICNETFSNESLYKRLWGPEMPFWNIEGHKEHEINRCERDLLGID